MIKEKNFYRLLLSVKTDLRKSAKKDAKEFLSLITWSVRVLKENNEDDSAINLFIYALDEYEKTYNKADQELCLESLKNAFYSLPEKSDKSKVKHRLLKFFESKSIADALIQNYNFYSLFAKDSLLNNDFTEGLRYALKSGDYELLNNFSENFEKNYSKSAVETFYFITRLTIELILLRNLSLAFKFISKYVKIENNFSKNHPVLNFAYLLTAFFCKDASNFDVFWTLINLYKPIIDVDGTFVKYLNKISFI